jgi:hypothetical protein
MLTIKNIQLVKQKQFSRNGKDYLLYGIDTHTEKYVILIMPFENEVWNMHNTQKITLYRNKDKINKGYPIQNKDKGITAYVNGMDMNSWISLFKFLINNNLI